MLIVAAVVGVGCFLYGCLTKDNCTWRYVIRPILISHAILISPLQRGTVQGLLDNCIIEEAKIKGAENNNGSGFGGKAIKYELEV